MHHIERSFHSWLLRQKHFEYRYRSINLHESREREARNSEFKYHLKHISFLIQSWYNCEVKTAQSCLTLCNPTDYSLPVSSFHGDSSGKNTGVGCRALLQGIFPIQGSNPGLPHCRQIPYPLSHQGSPRILDWVAYPFSRGSSWPRNQSRVSCIAGGFFTNWATSDIKETESWFLKVFLI